MSSFQKQAKQKPQQQSKPPLNSLNDHGQQKPIGQIKLQQQKNKPESPQRQQKKPNQITSAIATPSIQSVMVDISLGMGLNQASEQQQQLDQKQWHQQNNEKMQNQPNNQLKSAQNSQIQPQQQNNQLSSSQFQPYNSGGPQYLQHATVNLQDSLQNSKNQNPVLKISQLSPYQNSPESKGFFQSKVTQQTRISLPSQSSDDLLNQFKQQDNTNNSKKLQKSVSEQQKQKKQHTTSYSDQRDLIKKAKQKTQEELSSRANEKKSRSNSNSDLKDGTSQQPQLNNNNNNQVSIQADRVMSQQKQEDQSIGSQQHVKNFEISYHNNQTGQQNQGSNNQGSQQHNIFSQQQQSQLDQQQQQNSSRINLENINIQTKLGSMKNPQRLYSQQPSPYLQNLNQLSSQNQSQNLTQNHNASDKNLLGTNNNGTQQNNNNQNVQQHNQDQNDQMSGIGEYFGTEDQIKKMKFTFQDQIQTPPDHFYNQQQQQQQPQQPQSYTSLQAQNDIQQIYQNIVSQQQNQNNSNNETLLAHQKQLSQFGVHAKTPSNTLSMLNYNNQQKFAFSQMNSPILPQSRNQLQSPIQSQIDAKSVDFSRGVTNTGLNANSILNKNFLNQNLQNYQEMYQQAINNITHSTSQIYQNTSLQQTPLQQYQPQIQKKVFQAQQQFQLDIANQMKEQFNKSKSIFYQNLNQLQTSTSMLDQKYKYPFNDMSPDFQNLSRNNSYHNLTQQPFSSKPINNIFSSSSVQYDKNYDLNLLLDIHQKKKQNVKQFVKDTNVLIKDIFKDYIMSNYRDFIQTKSDYPQHKPLLSISIRSQQQQYEWPTLQKSMLSNVSAVTNFNKNKSFTGSTSLPPTIEQQQQQHLSYQQTTQKILNKSFQRLQISPEGRNNNIELFSENEIQDIVTKSTKQLMSKIFGKLFVDEENEKAQIEKLKQQQEAILALQKQQIFQQNNVIDPQQYENISSINQLSEKIEQANMQLKRSLILEQLYLLDKEIYKMQYSQQHSMEEGKIVPPLFNQQQQEPDHIPPQQQIQQPKPATSKRVSINQHSSKRVSIQDKQDKEIQQKKKVVATSASRSGSRSRPTASKNRENISSSSARKPASNSASKSKAKTQQITKSKFKLTPNPKAKPKYVLEISERRPSTIKPITLSFEERNRQWLEKKNLNMNKLQEEQEAQFNRRCSFRPKTLLNQEQQPKNTSAIKKNIRDLKKTQTDSKKKPVFSTGKYQKSTASKTHQISEKPTYNRQAQPKKSNLSQRTSVAPTEKTEKSQKTQDLSNVEDQKVDDQAQEISKKLEDQSNIAVATNIIQSTMATNQYNQQFLNSQGVAELLELLNNLTKSVESRIARTNDSKMRRTYSNFQKQYQDLEYISQKNNNTTLFHLNPEIKINPPVQQPMNFLENIFRQNQTN